MNFFKRLYYSLCQNAIAWIIAIISFAIIVWYTSYNGIGISPDSIVYLSTGRNIAAHLSFTEYSGGRLVDFPVGYPIFLAICNLISFTDPFLIAPYINGVLYASVILITDQLLKSQRTLKAWNRYLLLLVLAVSPALLSIYSMLWSETLFVLLLICFLLTLHRYLAKPSLRNLLICCIPAVLACITRYAGVTVVGTGMALILFIPQLNLRTRLKHLLIFASISISLLCVNIIRNKLVNGEATGSREAGIVSLQTNFGYYVHIVSNWFPENGMPVRLVFFVVGCTLIFFVLSALAPLWKRYAYGTVEHCCAVFVVVYTMFILGISTLTHFEQLNNRFLSPIYVPAMIVILTWLSQALQKLHLSVVSRKLIISVCFLGLICYNIVSVYRMHAAIKDYGIPGYTDNSWQKSKTANFLKKRTSFFTSGLSVYSNAHEGVYFLTGHKSKELPHHNNPITTKSFLKERLNYLVWFYQTKDADLLDSAAVMQHREVIGVYKFDDGSIFLLKNK